MRTSTRRRPRTTTTRRAHLARHARLVREHMTRLGQKRYWQQFDPAPEFVVMFLGDESWFRAALDHDPSLLEAGVEAGVVPASPTTLIALLRTVAYGWQQETVAESARSVEQARPRALRPARRLRRAPRRRREVARRARSATTTTPSGSFETRVLVTARKFPELGTGGDELPEVPPVATQPRPVLTAALDEDVADRAAR